MSNTPINSQALCFFDSLFLKKHNAFFANFDQKFIQNYKQNEDIFFAPLKQDFSENIYVFDTLTSTLDMAHTLVEKKCFSPFTSVICAEQTEGRGQLRRKWESMAENLYIAIALPNTYPFNSEAAAPALGAIIAKALDTLGFKIALKWPNDLVQQKEGKYYKVGGILLEERNSTLIAGMGINLFSFPQDTMLREDFFISAGKLDNFDKIANIKHYNQIAYESFKIGKNKSPNKKYCEDIFFNENNKFIAILGFWFALVKEIKICYEFFVKLNDQQAWLSLCKKYLAFLGDNILIKQALTKNNFQEKDCSESISGQIIDIGNKGQLILSSEYGLIEIIGGSIIKE